MWTNLTRSGVAVQIGYLQRNAHAPRVKHYKDLSTVVRWMKRTPSTLRHVAIPPPWSLLVMPDSAFEAAEPDYRGTDEKIQKPYHRNPKTRILSNGSLRDLPRSRIHVVFRSLSVAFYTHALPGLVQ